MSNCFKYAEVFEILYEIDINQHGYESFETIMRVVVLVMLLVMDRVSGLVQEQFRKKYSNYQRIVFFFE